MHGHQQGQPVPRLLDHLWLLQLRLVLGHPELLGYLESVLLLHVHPSELRRQPLAHVRLPPILQLHRPSPISLRYLSLLQLLFLQRRLLLQHQPPLLKRLRLRRPRR